MKTRRDFQLGHCSVVTERRSMLFRMLCSVVACATVASLVGCGIVPPPYQYAFGASPSDDRSKLARFESFFRQYWIYPRDQEGSDGELVTSATVFLPPGEYTLRIPTQNLVLEITSTDNEGRKVVLRGLPYDFVMRHSVAQGDRFYLKRELEGGGAESIVVYRISPSGKDRSLVKRVTLKPGPVKSGDSQKVVRRE